MKTFSQFAKEKKLTLRRIRQLADAGNYTYIEHMGERYELVQHGVYANGAAKYFIRATKSQASPKKKHLTPEQREAALNMLNEMMSKNEASAIAKVAEQFGVSYWSVYRLWNDRKVERKKRRDAGNSKVIIPAAARELFESIYIQNAQGPNTKLAYDLMRRQFPVWHLPYRYFLRIAETIEPERCAYHQAAGFEKEYAPRIRRDLWTEFEYMQRVSLDGWTVPDRVLRKWGLGEMTKKKFTYAGKDCSLVVIAAVDQKTGDVIAFKAFEKSVTKEDVLKLLLDVLYRRGRPSEWLLDNGTEFTNEDVQRFLRGLYTTEEHERYAENKKERIIFSEPYGPYGKARHERMHKIFKDEFCAFSRSYSPNAQESRKPSKKLSYVAPTHTLDEWVVMFESYLNGFFRERQRTNWMHPLYGRNAEINANRPRTLNEAVERAYATYNRVDVDAQKLAFLYASKFPAKVHRGLFNAPAKIGMGRRLRYLCPALPLSRYHETFEVVVSPLNVAQAWICDLNNNCIGEAWDIQARDAGATVTRDQATEYRKLRNRLSKVAREEATLKAQKVKMEELMKPQEVSPKDSLLSEAEGDAAADVFAAIQPPNEPETDLEVEADYFFTQNNKEGNNE